MCGCFCVGFINFGGSNARVTECANLFHQRWSNT